MAEFAYNNAKNASSGHTPFEFNCGYHSRMSYKKDVDPRSKSKSADKLSTELRELMIVCRENLHHAQELQKRAHDKGVKPRSYAPSDKVWLNSKYIKTKRNRKLEAKFFGPFRVLHPVGKQAYKLELPRKWRIYDVFHVSLLEQDTTRKGRVDKNATELAKLDAGEDSGEYEVEAICDSAVYARESVGHLPRLYYLVSWKGYPEEENTWEPASAVQHLKKLISSFHKDHPDKPTAISKAIDTAPLMARPIIKPEAKPTVKPTAPKRKRGRSPGKSTNKRVKKNWAAFDFYCVFGLFEVRVIEALSLEVTWFPNQPTFRNRYPSKFLSIKISIHRNFYLLNFYPSSFNLNLLRPTPLNCSFMHKASVFLLSTPTGLGGFSSMTFPPTLSTIFRFSSSVPTGLGGFSSIDLAGFPPQFSYWVRRFFTKLPNDYTFDGAHI